MDSCTAANQQSRRALFVARKGDLCVVEHGTYPHRVRTRVSFEWDYGYALPLRGLRDPTGRLSPSLRRSLRDWLDVLEAADPSDPDHPGALWVGQGRRLSQQVQDELGPNYEVVFWLDREQGRPR
jgi:hypothetical protein